MLAQNFKSAADLDITEKQRDALIKTLVLLETGQLTHVVPETLRLFESASPRILPFTGHFNMANWRSDHPCGTVACLGGTAEMVGDCTFDDYEDNEELLRLFNPVSNWGSDLWKHITDQQAAVALRNYLTTGDSNWNSVLARDSNWKSLLKGRV